MYFRNIPKIRDSDILLVTYPGSGTTWLANILCELGLPYIDGYTEELPELNTDTPAVFEARDRARTPALDILRSYRFRDTNSIRIIKTHLWPAYFETHRASKVILLVRDGRDSVVSYYHWRTAFSEEGEAGTLEQFLRRPGFNGVTPLIDWAKTYLDWISTPWVNHVHLIHLEDGKSFPESSVEKLLQFIGTQRTQSEILRASQASTFERMRAAEEHAICTNNHLNKRRIMRKGTSGQWKKEFSDADKMLIHGLPERALELLGYEP
jgi:hypothetical protein